MVATLTPDAAASTRIMPWLRSDGGFTTAGARSRAADPSVSRETSWSMTISNSWSIGTEYDLQISVKLYYVAIDQQ
jgi:hypothetical protein